jgi:preprotein translocase subunit SecF
VSRFGRRNGAKGDDNAPEDALSDEDEFDDEFDDEVDDEDGDESGDEGGEDEFDDVTDEELDADLEEAFDDPTVHASDLTPGLDEEERDDVDAAARRLIAGRRAREPRPGRERKVRHGPFARLYRGETRFDFVGKRRIWFSLSTALLVAGIVSIILRGGLNLGIEFKGGIEWTVSAPTVTQAKANDAMLAAGLPSPIVQLLGQGSNQHLNVQADLNHLSQAAQTAEENKVNQALARLTGQSVASIKNNIQTVGPTWGSSVTNKAIEALIIFFIVVGIYISIRFEPKMALAAFIAMVHDVLVAIGVYSLFNFQVTPSTVVAILTILGYSLYDTVVVFDRVRDNTKGIGSTGRLSYEQMINLSMNQTMARSINTSLVAILPVLSVLLVGAQFLGATTLQNYGLALFVGLLSGAYSSIFIAAPILAMLKRNESRWADIEERLRKKGGQGSMSALDAATMTTQMAVAAGGQPRPTPAKRSGLIRPGSGAAVGTAVMDRPAAGTGPGGAGGGAPSGSRTGGGGSGPAPRPRKGKGKGKRRR